MRNIEKEAAAFDRIVEEQRRRTVVRYSAPEVSKPVQVGESPNLVIRTTLSLRDIIGNQGGRRAIRPAYAW